MRNPVNPILEAREGWLKAVREAPPDQKHGECEICDKVKTVARMINPFILQQYHERRRQALCLSCYLGTVQATWRGWPKSLHNRRQT